VGLYLFEVNLLKFSANGVHVGGSNTGFTRDGLHASDRSEGIVPKVGSLPQPFLGKTSARAPAWQRNNSPRGVASVIVLAILLVGLMRNQAVTAHSLRPMCSSKLSQAA